MCQFDPEFPGDFAGWLELMRSAEEQARLRQVFPAPLLLDPAAFQAWCKWVSVIPCLDALRAYAIIQRGGSSPLGTPQPR